MLLLCWTPGTAVSVGGREHQHHHPAEPHRERLGWIPMGGRRRRKERRDMLLTGGSGALSGPEAGRSAKQGYLPLCVTGMYSSSVPWSWDPHLLDLLWSLDVLLHEGTLTRAMLCEG